MENQLINIDSRFRNKISYPNPAKFTYFLSEKIKNIVYIRLSSIELPNLYFTFSESKKNNFFKIILDNKTYDIIIKKGFYNSGQLLNSIQEELSKLPKRITIECDLVNGFVSLNCISPFVIDFTNTGCYPSLGYHLGFRNNNCESSHNVVGIISNYYVTGIAPLNVIGDNYVFLNVNNYGKIHNPKNFDGHNREVIYNYLGKIILNVNKTEQVFDNHNLITKEYNFKQPIDIGHFDIELLDPLNNTINMETIDFSLTLELGIIYDNELYQKNIRNGIK